MIDKKEATIAGYAASMQEFEKRAQLRVKMSIGTAIIGAYVTATAVEAHNVGHSIVFAANTGAAAFNFCLTAISLATANMNVHRAAALRGVLAQQELAVLDAETQASQDNQSR